jgi:hypothetical protein
MKKNITILAVTGMAAVLALTGCESAASTASKNVSTEADNFNVQRKITGLNTRTGEFAFYAEGRCSISREEGDLVAICKHSDTEYRKHILMEATDIFVSVTQMAPIDVSEYHTKVILKPQGIIPDLDLKVQL